MKLKPLAVAIGIAAVPFVASAASVVSVDTDADSVSAEYLSVYKGVEAPRATVALGAQYAAGDVITFTYTHTPRATQTATTAFSWPATLGVAIQTQIAQGTSGTASTVTTNAAGTDGQLALFDSSDKSVSYRVTTAPSGGIQDDGDTPDFGEITLPDNIYFLASELGADDVFVTPTSATSQGVAFDAGNAKKIIDQTPGQFAYTISGLSQTIDVESDRKAFLVSSSTQSTISIGFTVNTNALGTAAESFALPGTVAVTLAGDFSWIDSSSTATGIQTSGVALSAGTLGGISASSIGLTLAASDTSSVLTLTNGLSLVIPNGSISADLTGQYNNGSTSAVGLNTLTSTGAFSLNGSSVTVFAVPTSEAVSNFIWLTNTGANDGDVSLVIHDNGTDYDLGVVGQVSAKTEFDVSAAMAAALEAQGVTLSGGRVHIDIVTKVPSADVAVSAAYRVGDDRVNLLSTLDTDIAD